MNRLLVAIVSPPKHLHSTAVSNSPTLAAQLLILLFTYYMVLQMGIP